MTLRIATLALITLFVGVFLQPSISRAANANDPTFILRPYCDEGYDGNEWIYGPVPPPGWTAGEDPNLCSPFEIDDPQTLRTPLLLVGETLDIDLVVQNPGERPISSIRTWLTYDPDVLEGTDITINDIAFPEITPGEEDFSAEDGYVKIQVSAIDDAIPTDYWIHVARIQFTVKKEISPGTVMNFHDVQPNGHTVIMSKGDVGKARYILGQEPGSLMVRIGTVDTGPAPLLQIGAPCVQSDECASGQCEANICIAAGENSLESCTLDGECNTSMCYGGFCRSAEFKIPTDGACRRDNQCASLVCRNGKCSGATNIPNGEGCTSNLECASGTCSNGVCIQTLDDNSCASDFDCDPGNICTNSICTREQAVIPNGGTCVLSTQCQSSLCVEGVCKDQETHENDRTAFSLLQIRNLRVTSDGNSAFLGWDPLRSSMLKTYNMYYGTTSGQYIQRKILPGTSPSVTIRNLPSGTTYYFAIRASNKNDEESAFSQEVAVEIGNPASSTAPLVASVLTDAPKGNPLTDGPIDVPGETGIPSIFVVFLIISGVIGTLIASRRQVVASSFAPTQTHE